MSAPGSTPALIIASLVYGSVSVVQQPRWFCTTQKDGKMFGRTVSRQGFTLVELIIVLNIAAILVALLIPTYRTVSAARSQNACEARLQAAFQQIQEFKRDNKRYPQYFGELYPQYIESKSSLMCPADSREQQGAPVYAGGYGYDLLYTIRQTGEPGQEIMCGCPFHKKGLVLTIDGKIEKGEFQDAKLTSVAGATSIIRHNSNWENGDWLRETGSAGKELYVGDTVVTDVGGTAVVQLDDKGSTVTVDQNTEFTLNLAKAADDPTSLIRIASVRAAITGAFGHVTAVIDPSHSGVYSKGGGRFEIATPSAVAAVRGTAFELWVYLVGEQQLTEVQVTNGKVELISDKGNQTVTLDSGRKKTNKKKNDDDEDDDKGKRKNKERINRGNKALQILSNSTLRAVSTARRVFLAPAVCCRRSAGPTSGEPL